MTTTTQPDVDDASCHSQCHTNHCGNASLPSCCVTPMEPSSDPPHPADGCDERCCPGFWLDENSIESPKPPPVPILSWVFDPHNRVLNDNRRMRIFGNVGTRWADAHRKPLMGLALALTVASIPVAVLGCFGAGSNDETVITYTNWAFAWVMLNETAAGCVGMSAEIGLRSIVFEKCIWDDCDEGQDAWKQPMSRCTNERQNWDRAAKLCDGDDGSLGIFDCATINGCHRSASGGGDWETWVGSQQQNAYVTCFTLIFAMMGCLTRIRWRQDTNFQKLIGCMPDTLTAVTGIGGLNGFVDDCYAHMAGATHGGRDVSFTLGVGYKAFWCCWAAQVGRALIHWIVPVPGGGGGLCTFSEPPHAKRLLAGSGTDSYREALRLEKQKSAGSLKVAPSGMALPASTWEEPVEFLP